MVGRPTAAFAALLVLLLAGCSGTGGEDPDGKGDGDDLGGSDVGSTQPSTQTTPPAPSSGSSTTTTTSSSSSSSSSSAPARPAQTVDLDIQGNDFVDGSITIQKGDTVRWTQNDLVQHTVTSDSGAFDSGNLLLGQSFSFTFATVGSFPYHCEIHASMTDTITVVESIPA